MDTTITSEPTSSGTAVTETPATPGTETAGLGEGQTAASEASGEQSTAEGSQPQEGRRRGSSLYQDVIKLRAQNRELRESFGQIDQLREDFAALRDELARRNQTGVAKTPANFWQDPEAVLESKLEEKLERLQNNMFERFQTTRDQEYAEQARAQETESAAKFIRSQPNYEKSDDTDLIEIIEENNLAMLGPTKAAEIAWVMLQQQRGIGDRSIQKQRASGIQGQPPGVGFGRKTWNKAEFDQAVELVEKNPHDPKMSELFNELMSAHKEGRVR